MLELIKNVNFMPENLKLTSIESLAFFSKFDVADAEVVLECYKYRSKYLKKNSFSIF